MGSASRKHVGIIGAGRLALPWPRVQEALEGLEWSGQDAVSSLFGDAGFFTIDLGTLITGGAMRQVGAPLAGVNLIRLSGAT